MKLDEVIKRAIKKLEEEKIQCFNCKKYRKRYEVGIFGGILRPVCIKCYNRLLNKD